MTWSVMREKGILSTDFLVSWHGGKSGKCEKESWWYWQRWREWGERVGQRMPKQINMTEIMLRNWERDLCKLRGKDSLFKRVLTLMMMRQCCLNLLSFKNEREHKNLGLFAYLNFCIFLTGAIVGIWTLVLTFCSRDLNSYPGKPTLHILKLLYLLNWLEDIFMFSMYV